MRSRGPSFLLLFLVAASLLALSIAQAEEKPGDGGTPSTSDLLNSLQRSQTSLLQTPNQQQTKGQELFQRPMQSQQGHQPRDAQIVTDGTELKD